MRLLFGESKSKNWVLKSVWHHQHRFFSLIEPFLTAVNVGGRKASVRMAMMHIKELSLDVASKTCLESSARDFIAVLSL
jgi:N-acyl-D-aspartate/D-glutamate deacylase